MLRGETSIDKVQRQTEVLFFSFIFIRSLPNICANFSDHAESFITKTCNYIVECCSDNMTCDYEANIPVFSFWTFLASESPNQDSGLCCSPYIEDYKDCHA